MLITVAICTWNRSDLLDQTLTSLRTVRVPAGCDWEVIVVDNNCTDNTGEVLVKHAPHLPLRPLKEPAQGHSNARNCALAAARGAWIVWTDDDVQVEPQWLEAFAGTAQRNPHAASIGGTVDPWFVTTPSPALVAAFEQVRIGYCGVDHGRAERELKPEELIFGANMAYNLERTAGLKFDPRRGRKAGFQAGGDDLDFLSRARERGPLVWSPDMRVKHYVDPNRLTLAYVRKFFRDNGRCIAEADGVPGGGRTLLGVPTWLLEKCLKHRAAAVWKRLRHGRVAALREMQTVWMREGMVLACYASRKRPAVPSGGGVPT